MLCLECMFGNVSFWSVLTFYRIRFTSLVPSTSQSNSILSATLRRDATNYSYLAAGTLSTIDTTSVARRTGGLTLSSQVKTGSVISGLIMAPLSQLF